MTLPEQGGDTNQASEEIINAFIKKWAGDHAAHLLDNDDNDGERLRQAIQSIIRTEKLKLLAEVRERVVGEDERLDIQSEFDKLDVPHLETDKYTGLDGVRQASRNMYRNHQRVELTQLEAEL